MKKVFGWIFIVCGILSILKDIELIWVTIFFIILGILMLILPTREIPEKTTLKSGLGWTLIILGLLIATSIPFGGLLYDDTFFGLSLIVISIGIAILGIWMVNSPEKKKAEKSNMQLFNFFQRKQKYSYQDDKIKYENLRLIKELLDSGAFTQYEFDKEKQKIFGNSITDTDDKRGCTTDDMLLSKIDDEISDNVIDNKEVKMDGWALSIVIITLIVFLILLVVAVSDLISPWINSKFK